MLKRFSKVRFGQAFKQYDAWDGDLYFVKVDDGAVCAFDWYSANENPVVYDCFDDDEMVNVVPLMEAMDWVREAIEEA